MCGVAGILTADAEIGIDEILLRMQSALRHRGPDGEGLAIINAPDGRRLGLAHTRLAILDLTDAGTQPMSDERTGSWIAYNGEVYNHQELRTSLRQKSFRSRTDTETVLHAWIERGRDALGDLRGMFAFALYDGQRQKLTLVRDRLGIKPMYVTQASPGTWLFASEVRAILASGLVPATISRAGLNSYLAWGSVAAPETIIQGVQSLMPAETWTFDLREPGDPHRERYWTPSLEMNGQAADLSAAEVVRENLAEATRLRTLADVPVGVFLSGGIDSTAVVGAMREQGIVPHTFSVTFAERDFDESSHSRAVARHFQTVHTELPIRGEDLISDMDEALAAYDQPSIDGANTYFISRAVRRSGVKVVLSGLGGDELFYGYPSFSKISLTQSGGGRMAAQLAALALRCLQPRRLRTTKLASLLAARDPLTRYAVFRQITGNHRISRLLDQHRPHGGPWLAPNVEAMLHNQADRLDPINAHAYLDLALYMANTLLRDTDQMSMAHGLEVRVPLLDHPLVEHVLRLPSAIKMGRHPKQLLFETLPKSLPQTVWKRRKMGFTFPWDHWLRNELRDHTASRLCDDGAWTRLGIAPQEVKRRWRDFLAHHPDVRFADILLLLNLAEWSSHHIGAHA